MLCNVEAADFIFFLNAKLRKDTDDADTDQGTGNCDCDRHEDTDDLGNEKSCFTEYKAVPLSNGVDRTLSEQSGCNTSPDTADAVASERVEGVVDFQFMLDDIHHKVADRAYQSTDDERKPRSARNLRPV